MRLKEAVESRFLEAFSARHRGCGGLGIATVREIFKRNRNAEASS
jgi:hypothetical protein